MSKVLTIKFKTVMNSTCLHYNSDKPEEQWVMSSEDLGDGKKLNSNYCPITGGFR